MTDSGFEFDMGLGDPARAGVYAVGDGDLRDLAAAARDAGLRVCRIDLQGCSDKRTLLMRIATQLDFPSGQGRNWDALSDGLRDLSWLPGKGYALLFNDASGLQAASPGDFATLLDILGEAVNSWADAELPFWAFLELAGHAPTGNESDA